MAEHQDFSQQQKFLKLFFLQVKDCFGLTEEEFLSIEKEKQLFPNEIGFDVDKFKEMFNNDVDFFIREANAFLTDEKIQSILEKTVVILKGVNYKTALEKYIREKKQKSTSPAASPLASC